MARGDLLRAAIAEDGVLPEGAAVRESGHSRKACVFGVTEAAAQELVVEGAREAMRRRGLTQHVAIEFWSGEPPPPGRQVNSKPPATRDGSEAPPEAPDPSRQILRTVWLATPGDRRAAAPSVEDQRSAVVSGVRASGAVPPHGGVGHRASTLRVRDVEDAAAQDAIVAAARDALARHAPGNAHEVFEAVVFWRLDVSYAPNGRMSAESVVTRTVALD